MRCVKFWIICGGIGSAFAAKNASPPPLAQATPVKGDVGRKDRVPVLYDAESIASQNIDAPKAPYAVPFRREDPYGPPWTCHGLIQGTLPLPADGRVHPVCQQAQMACVSLNAFRVLEEQGQTGLSKEERKKLKRFLQYQSKQWIQSCRIAHTAYQNPSVVAQIFAQPHERRKADLKD